MSNNGPSEISAKTGQGKPKSGLLHLLRALSLIALAVGATGSLIFMFRTGQNTPRFLLILFTIWVLSPFAVLLWANIVLKRWLIPTQIMVYCVTLISALGSLAIYSERIDVRPTGSANAFLYVIVPPVSLLFITIAVVIAAFLSGRRSRREDDT